MSAGRIVTFTNLFPSSVLPQHGLFVAERMRRVVAQLGCAWRVVCPVPDPVWWLRPFAKSRAAAFPAAEHHAGVEILHPRYRHWPKIGLHGQAQRMAAGARGCVQALGSGGRTVLDAHYLYPDGVAAAVLARELGLRYTLTARGTDLNLLAEDPRIAAQIQAAAAGATALFAVSEPLCARFAAVAGVPRERVLLARNGVDLDLFRPGDQAAARRALGLPAGRRLLLGVGRLVPAKGFALLATALQQLDVDLVLVGDGPERARLQAVLPRVTLLGPLPPARVALAYQACDLLVLPSEREGWPNVVTEALAAGLQVVATAVGGIPQIVSAPVAGRLVPPGDAQALATAIAQMLAAPAERSAVRAFASRYGWDEPVALLCRVFAAALQ